MKTSLRAARSCAKRRAGISTDANQMGDSVAVKTRRATRKPAAGGSRSNPARESAGDFFLHVLIASDAGRSQNLPQVKGSTRDGQTAIVEIADGTGKATLQFRTKGQTSGHITIARKGRTIVDDPLPANVVLSD